MSYEKNKIINDDIGAVLSLKYILSKDDLNCLLKCKVYNKEILLLY
jgi:hypothetical protein